MQDIAKDDEVKGCTFQPELVTKHQGSEKRSMEQFLAD